ncbi:unnamed protein product [Nezara viridula]|uniref:Enoyl reductase (ER) domain-containing protein n=1 Tax=Nezara viridula TaxID=85310 RepID=A0A9P0MY26_NEZVI|nr:unnamed protein product [Nezara viridula]
MILEEFLLRVAPVYGRWLFNLPKPFSTFQKLVFYVELGFRKKWEAGANKAETGTTSVFTVSDEDYSWIVPSQNALKSKECTKVIFLGPFEEQNGVLGFVNCIRKESEGQKAKCVLLLDNSIPEFQLENTFYKEQLAKDLAINIVKNGKWGTYRHFKIEEVTRKPAFHVFTNLLTRGDLSSLNWIQGPITDLNGDDKVVIQFTALNFRDVMLATGKLAAEVIVTDRKAQSCVIGFEFGGIDKNGKRVIGISQSGALSSIVAAHRNLTWDIPDNWTMEDAVTVPVVYATVSCKRTRVDQTHRVTRLAFAREHSHWTMDEWSADQSAVLFIDSQAAILAVTSTNECLSSAILECKSLLSNLTHRGTNVVLQWIPSHCGIPGNVEADILAKRGTDLPQPIHPKPYDSIRRMVKMVVKEEIRKVHFGKVEGKRYEWLKDNPIPAELPRRDAVLYAFIERGKIKKGNTILIHSGTGGVGQAAIHVALFKGCTVFTTVGTQEKRDFIKKHFPQIKESHIGNSRDTTFEQMIMRETNGRGVDMVLNSLAEDKLLASVRCLAKGGQFLEIGKFDLSRNNPLDQ